MSESALHTGSGLRPTLSERLLLGMTPKEYVRSLMTPWDAIFGLVLAIGIPCIVLRFVFGLGAVTNLSQTTPWGLWIGFDMLCGVALAAGGFTLAAAVYVFGLKDYKPVERSGAPLALEYRRYFQLCHSCPLGGELPRPPLQANS